MPEPIFRRIGVTVMPEFFQTEGIDAVLANISDRLGATSVTTSPYIGREGVPGRGFREPPDDAGAGGKRLLDRPLWGKREVFIETAPSFSPNYALYTGSEYQPERPTELTTSDGPIIKRFLHAAKLKGLKTYLQIMAAIPPGLRVQVGEPLESDHPLLPDGSPMPPRVDRNATLASQSLRFYMRALIQDLCQNYPECDGFKFDWPEYPPYDFMSLFADYNPQVAPYARELGIDLTALAKGIIQVRQKITSDLSWENCSETPVIELLTQLRVEFAALDDHFRLRTHLVEKYAEFLKSCVDEASDGSKLIFLQGFPPPWHMLSGFDPKILRQHADELAVKFYTMHWPMIGANYVRRACREFGLPQEVSAKYFRWNFMGQQSNFGSLDDLVYPEPDVSHGIPSSKIASAYRQFGDREAIGITHSYGPCDDVVLRCRALLDATGGNIEINRYAYLSEDKIDALASLISCSTELP